MHTRIPNSHSMPISRLPGAPVTARRAGWRPVLAGLAAGLLASAPALAQRGMGDDIGVAQWDTPPQTQPIAGRVSDIQIAECKHTTGKADIGAHVFLDTDDGRTLNVHLGPFDVLEELVENLEDGTPVAAEAFRTEAMPADHFVAVTLTIDGSETRLRAADDLRPVWATGPAGPRGPRAGAGRGPGEPGAGPGAREPRLRGRGPQVMDDCWWQPGPRRRR